MDNRQEISLMVSNAILILEKYLIWFLWSMNDGLVSLVATSSHQDFLTNSAQERS